MPQVPETDPMKIIRPNRFFCMVRDARWATRNAPVRLASMTFWNLSSVIRMRNASAETPALATTTSTGPWCSSTAVNAASTAAESVTSQTTPNSPSGAPEPRWVTATLWPSAASRRATVSPIPRLPPVTSTERDTNGGAPAASPVVLLSVTGSTYRLRRRAARRGRSGGQSAVDQQPGHRRQRQHHRAQAQPAGAGVALDRLVADLVLQVVVDLLELLEARGGVEGAVGQVGDRSEERRVGKECGAGWGTNQ